jgi:hypothetical protein
VSSESITNLTRKVYGCGDNQTKNRKNIDKKEEGEQVVNSLYQYVSGQIERGEITPTFTPMKKSVYGYLKVQKKEGVDVPTMPRIQVVVEGIQSYLLSQGVIVENPNYGRGKSKYLTA